MILKKEDTKEEKKRATKLDNTGEEQVVHNLQLLLSMSLSNPLPMILLKLKPQNSGLFMLDLPWCDVTSVDHPKVDVREDYERSTMEVYIYIYN